MIQFLPPSELFLYRVRAPKKSGIYAFLNKKKEIIYIGKAANMRGRMQQYILDYVKFHWFFTNGKKVPHNYRLLSNTRLIIKRLSDVMGIKFLYLYGNKTWAERRMIRRFGPKYNVQFVRDSEPHYFEWQRTDNYLKKLFNWNLDEELAFITPVRKE